MRLLVPVLLLLAAVSVQGFLKQSVAMKGILNCRGNPLASTKVKLWDKNTFGKDEVLAENVTDSRGNFQLAGSTSSLFKMDVNFKVYHDCEDGIKPCQRKVSLPVPDAFVYRADVPERVFDAGNLNMAFRFPNEERSCIN